MIWIKHGGRNARSVTKGSGKDDGKEENSPLSSFPSPLTLPLVTLLAFCPPCLIQIETTGDEFIAKLMLHETASFLVRQTKRVRHKNDPYSRARALSSLNLKKRRDCSQSNVGSEMQECGRGYIKKVNKRQFVALSSVRGTQREYSSKPHKQSIVERTLVFKR